MVGFLVAITRTGLLERVIWNEPDDLLSGCSHSLLELFSENGRAALLKAMKRSAQNEGLLACETSARLMEQSSAVTVCVMSIGQEYLVLALEDKIGKIVARIRGVQGIVQKLLEIIMDFAFGKTIGSKAAADSHVEIIQTLTSELRNRKKLLEDTNAQMNDINKDLNNRLVKDALTGLISRYQYRSEIEYAVAQNPGKLGVFVFIDIDDFKGINDNYGHAAGDQYLVEFADRLKSIPIDEMIRMRISGDEFGLFVPGLADAKAARMESLWRNIKESVLSRPILINGQNLPISVSAGMSVYGQDTLDIYELIENADFAMYSAKRKGKNRYAVYEKTESLKMSGGKK